VAKRIVANTTMLPVVHLTAVNHSIRSCARPSGKLLDAGVANVLAVRGDPLGDVTGEWVRHPRWPPGSKPSPTIRPRSALGIEQAILLASDCSPSLHFLTFNTARATRQVLGVGEAATDRFDDDDAAVHVHGFDAPGENPVRVVW
jgi:5,10-methylenetetrahydrofolate reductase